jgi:hypothetical protein
MSKVLILVEGQTEESFVKQILSPHLATLAIFPIVIIITTRRRPDLKDFKGGIGSYNKIKTDVRPLLRDTSAALLTTMIDYYGLPLDFPGMATCPAGSCHERLRHPESEFAKDINHQKFLPYLALHEFVALLFASPAHIAAHFPHHLQLPQLESIKSRFGSPEEIDDGPSTAPSKRIRALYPEYQKRADGPTMAQKIGLELIRKECPHFNDWLTKLEMLGNKSI